MSNIERVERRLRFGNEEEEEMSDKPADVADEAPAPEEGDHNANLRFLELIQDHFGLDEQHDGQKTDLPEWRDPRVDRVHVKVNWGRDMASTIFIDELCSA